MERITKKYRYRPFLSLIFALSLVACGPAPVSTPPSSSPVPTRAPEPSTSSPPTVIPSASSGTLTLRLQADASLAGFATTAEKPLTLCLGQIAKARTVVGGQSDERALTLKTLLDGLEIALSGVPAGSV
ncbi:MAG: hypothetical protein ACAI44_26300, partial [Candidatus Sericytochromatia bacterium]